MNNERKERFIGDEKSVTVPQCNGCVHYNGKKSCKAFRIIPIKILLNEHDHTQPYPGDNGIRYEPTKAA